MKAYAPTEERADDDSEDSDDEDAEETSIDTRLQRPNAEQQISERPQLVRSPRGQPSELSSGGDAGGISARGSTDGTAESREKRATASESKGKAPVPKEDGRLSSLKDAVNAKLAFHQRKRGSYGASSLAQQKRVSPIHEETTGLSPTLNAAFSSPADAVTRPLSTTLSTESTESGRTVRASVPSTPADVPLRTPSYPFPVVPGTPRTWSSSFHQPFTALSPTVTALPTGHEDKDSGSQISSESTPAATANDFMPRGAGFQGQEDPRFPTPNLYDAVLQLNAEPGMEPWWAMVTNMMHDQYKAERVTLMMPLDPTDIENVPWGQKATFNLYGREEYVPHDTVLEQTSHVPSADVPSGFQKQRLHPERIRPRLELRHSYAGHGREAQTSTAEPQTKSAARPPGPLRTVTHAQGIPGGVGAERMVPQRFPTSSTIRHTSMSDLDFSSIGGVDVGPHTEVFANLRNLETEVHPLLEPGGVNRVLERGRIVTVTRDYASDASDSSYGKDSSAASTKPDTTPKAAPAASTLDPAKMFGDYRSIFATDNAPEMLRTYEEYEQYSASPWAQSPAPSPALQADEDMNPFFKSEEQEVEDTFNPDGTPKDYSRFAQVEAIGVDRANTVIHIPLVHPTLSQPMQSMRMKQSTRRPGVAQRSDTLDIERKSPIAILSVMSPVVPYPHNLTHSMSLLGPHLATSLANAQQFSPSHLQALSIRHRRTASGHRVSALPMTIAPLSTEDAHDEQEGYPRSISDSVASPSGSTRSKQSPSTSGSIVGTPGWDPAAHGWTASRSAAATPNFSGSDMVDNYFDSKKRQPPRASGPSAQNTPIKSARPFVRDRSGTRRASPMSKEDPTAPRSDPQIKHARPSLDERSPVHPDLASPQRPPLRSSVSNFADSHAARKHSVLHSYGAEFETSTGALTSGAGLDPHPTGPGHARRSSYSDDMPPPSERLLRTIIDSVPVQIFTAMPETGQLSWLNSKFLIYRGQEPREVLAEPWQAIHPDDRDEFMTTWHRSLRTTQQLQQKVRLRRFDGSFRWFYVRAAPLRDKRGKIVHWIGTMMDFHEQHIAESNAARQQETAASEAKYRALANSSPQIVFAVNKTKGVTFCNSQWVHYSGQTELQAHGVGFMDHVHPDDLAKCRLPTFDDHNKEPVGVPTTVPPDIKRTKTSLSMSATSSSGSSETEKGVYSSESSPSTSTMPQRKLSELASVGILRVARDADGRPSYSTEVRLKSKDGEFRWHLVRVLLAEPYLQSINQEETWYGTCTDINDHKTLERDLKETMDDKSKFLSNMSHEIRTPLNGITGMVNFLIDSSLTAEQMEHVNIIRASTEGLRGLINDILDLSKAEAGMISLSLDWLYVRALIEEVNDLTCSMAIDKGLELNYMVEEDVPAQVKGDRFRLRQILLNVIGNAIKFTQKGEIFVRCSTYVKEGEDLASNETLIRFEVVDTGSGFTEKEAEYLFKRFSQIDGSSTRQHGGTGLGLVISRQLAQLHGGDMSAKGVPGKGSTFSVYIKTTLPTRDDQPPPPTPSVGGSPLMPGVSGPTQTPTLAMTMLSKTSSAESNTRAAPRFLPEMSQTPSPFLSPDLGKASPASTSSDPSFSSAARTSSLRSERSSASSYIPDPSLASPPIRLTMPSDARHRGDSASTSSSYDSNDSITPRPTKSLFLTPQVSEDLVAPMYSILVVCPLKYSREATVQHIGKTLPKTVPHQITAREDLAECEKLLGGEDPVHFTHVVISLQDVDDIAELIGQILGSPAHSTTTVVIITDLAQRKKLMDRTPKHDYEKLSMLRRVIFVFKPLKPSRFAAIFDPQKEREMSTDRNQDSAQQVATNQKQVFEELTKRLGNKDKRVLLVEDNKVNQMVILKFLSKVSIKVDTALDGVICTEKVFAQPHDYYSIILCDLHMPNKDGYQTCKDIRKWERHEKFAHLPIVALSANVLGDVQQKCVDAGFSSYMTKPVDFKELSTVLMGFMDPADPEKVHELMKMKVKKGHSKR